MTLPPIPEKRWVIKSIISNRYFRFGGKWSRDIEEAAIFSTKDTAQYWLLIAKERYCWIGSDKIVPYESELCFGW